jgi:alpha-glucosidase
MGQVIRHATRFGIPASSEPTDAPFVTNDAMCEEFLFSGGKGYDQKLGLQRARAATLMMLGLPGSCYIYQ